MSNQPTSSSDSPKSVKPDIPGTTAGIPTSIPTGIPTSIPTGIPTNPADLAKIASMNPADMNPAALSSIALNAGPPTPAQVALNYLLFTLYSLAGTLIYYPSLIVNLPESTLEESLPKQDLCMKMGFSKRICKKKIKCLFKNCDYLDDPIGYKLDKQFKKPCKRKRRMHDVTNKNSMVGGKKQTRKYPRKMGWRRHLSKNMKKQLKNEYKKNIYNFISNRTKTKRNRRTKKYYGGTNKNILKPDTCKNKKTRVFCSLRNGSVVYPEPLIFSETLQKKIKILEQFSGGNPDTVNEKYSDKLIPFIKNLRIDNFDMSGQPVNHGQQENASSSSQNDNSEAAVGNPEDDEKERKLLIKSFFIEKVKTNTLFKLAIIIKAMDHLFADEKITESETNRATNSPAEKEDISVVFPWKFNDPNMCLSDKIKCISAHVTQTKFEREQDPDLYDKCFVCKHCTLRNTSSRVWGGVIKGLLAGNKSKQFVTLINNVFGLLNKYILFPFMTDKQYYLTTLISLQLAHENLEIDKIDSVFENGTIGGKFKLKDLILGIPPISFTDKDDLLKSYRDDLRQCYINFQQIGIVDGINGIYYKSVFRKYFEIDHHDKNEKLEYLKNIALQNYELLYIKSRQARRQSQEIFEKIHHNTINTKDMDTFSHFENTLEKMKYSTDYKVINNKLNQFLKPQYKFLLDSNNFEHNESFTNTRYNNAYDQYENEIIVPSLKNITMKLF